MERESMISIARLLLFFVITMGYNAFFRNTVIFSHYIGIVPW